MPNENQSYDGLDQIDSDMISLVSVRRKIYASGCILYGINESIKQQMPIYLQAFKFTVNVDIDVHHQQIV